MTSPGTPPGPPSWRKPVGALAIVGIIIVYAAVVTSLWPAVNGWPWFGQALFWLVAGLLWIAPLRPLLVWMELGRWRV